MNSVVGVAPDVELHVLDHVHADEGVGGGLKSMLAPCRSSAVGRGRLLQGGRGGLLPPSGPGSGSGIRSYTWNTLHHTQGAASFMEFF